MSGEWSGWNFGGGITLAAGQGVGGQDAARIDVCYATPPQVHWQTGPSLHATCCNIQVRVYVDNTNFVKDAGSSIAPATIGMSATDPSTEECGLIRNTSEPAGSAGYVTATVNICSCAGPVPLDIVLNLYQSCYPVGSSGSGYTLFSDLSITDTCSGHVIYPGSGSIVVEKVTHPSAISQSFSFTTSYGSPFNLTDGQSNNSGPLNPGTYSVTEAPVAGFTTVVSQDPTAIVVTNGVTTTVTFTNSENVGIVALGGLTDTGTCISSRYVTYGFADAQERAQFQMGQDRVLYPYALVNIEGTGAFELTMLPETIATPYPFTQPNFALSTPVLDDVNVPLNVTGNRAFIQIESAGTACTNWNLKRIALATTDDPRMRITGR